MNARKLRVVCTAVLLTAATPTGLYPSVRASVVIGDVPAYGYNVSPAPDGQPRIIGCGPTTGVMILDTYDNRGATGLIVDPLSDARLLHNSYMNTNAAGFGSPSDFHFGLEDFARDRGYIVDAVIHVEPTTYNPSNWSAYTLGTDLLLDATFWNTSTWDILVDPFLDFLAAEIDQGRPVSITVDSNSDGRDDHWMVGLGYDRTTKQWAGYNTWDTSLHWYNVTSAFIPGNEMGIGYVRTFTFNGPIPEPTTFAICLLLGVTFICAWSRRRNRRCFPAVPGPLATGNQI